MISTDALKSLAARAGWTALQAALGAVTVYLSSIDPASQPGSAAIVIVAVATVLSALKSFVATKVGDPDTVTFR
jgi:hypothetical protein